MIRADRLFVFLLFASSLSAQTHTVKLNGGLEAELLTLGRSENHKYLTLSMRMTNKGKNVAYLLLVGSPVATDNIGEVFNRVDTVGGIAYCDPYGGRRQSQCWGVPGKIDITVPFQTWTRIDPDPDIKVIINMRLSAFHESQGPLISLSAYLAYRLVSDPLQDAATSDSDKAKQVNAMTLSVPAMSVTDAK